MVGLSLPPVSEIGLSIRVFSFRKEGSGSETSSRASIHVEGLFSMRESVTIQDPGCTSPGARKCRAPSGIIENSKHHMRAA